MPTLTSENISTYYELHGDPGNPPVLMITGLGGVGAEWGPLIKEFAKTYYVIVPDQRGTGRTTHAPDGYTTAQLARDMVNVVRHLDVGPVHLVGASTGAAIGQHMALDHPGTIRSLTMSGAFARFDAYARRGSHVRRTLVLQSERRTRYECYACFLFSPRFTREHPERVQAWIDGMVDLAESEADHEIVVKRIDMIASHDTLDRLDEIRQPCLVLCGDRDVAAPLPHAEEIVDAVPNSELIVFEDAGHLIEYERADEFLDVTTRFIDKHRS